MPYILNARDEVVKVTAFSKVFEFNPRQIKAFDNPNLCRKICDSYGEAGLVLFPEEAMEMDRGTKEFKDLLEEKIIEGKLKRLKKLEMIRYNEEVSLKRDLDIKNLKTSPFTFANSEIVKAYKELAQLKEQLKTKHKTESYNYEEQLKALVEKIDNGDVSQSNPGTPDTRHASNTETTKSGK